MACVRSLPVRAWSLAVVRLAHLGSPHPSIRSHPPCGVGRLAGNADACTRAQIADPTPSDRRGARANTEKSSRKMSAGGIFIDPTILGKRLNAIYDRWIDSEASHAEGFGSDGARADALCIITGKTTDELRYMKSIALEMWLFAYELPETLIVLLPNRQVHVVTGKTKANLISATKDKLKEAAKSIDLTIHVRSKGTTGEDHFNAVLGAAKGARPEGSSTLSVGSLLKDKHEGAFFDTWKKCVASFDGGKAKEIDVALGFSHLLACKSSDEQTCAKKAAYLATQCMRNFVIPKLEETIDEERKVKHSTLSAQIEDRILEPSKLEVRLKQDKVNICYSPILQSGGDYDVKLTAQSKDTLLSSDTILCSLGARYASYCSNVARTIFVDPTKDQQRHYQALLKAQAAAIDALREGVMLRDVYKAAVNELEKEGCPELRQHLSRNVGFGMGLELRESSFVINEKSERKATPGMVFNLSVSVVGVSSGKEKEGSSDQPAKYAMQIADTVLVTQEGNAPEILTDVPKTYKDVAYVMNEDDEDVEEVLPAKRTSALRPSREQNQATEESKQAEEMRKAKQDELTQKINEETLRFLTHAKQSDGDVKSKEIKVSHVVRVGGPSLPLPSPPFPSFPAFTSFPSPHFVY